MCDEAVPKFIRHLKSQDARVQIRSLYRGDRCPSIDENRTFSFLPPTSYSSNSPVADDPMDLSALRDAIQYINSISNRGGRGFRGGFRDNNNNYNGGGFQGGSSRGGGFRGIISRGGGFRGGYQGRFNNGGYENQETRACFTCGQVGHLQYNCRQGNIHDNNDNINKDQTSSDLYSTRRDLILYSVLPSSSAYIEPLVVNDDTIKKDVEFMFNANLIQNKLPLYRIYSDSQNCPNVL
ncbi:hypothetical protein MFLAVUS_011228 [Mucor flavus]|uniref:CCHC-type domain-containing protein n=1 Tax=Mucor flavus TaxID=439312 RepID=A0ABP9ZF17_9FUNG